MPYVARKTDGAVALHHKKLGVAGTWPNTRLTGRDAVDPSPSATLGRTEAEVRATVADIVRVQYGPAVAKEVDTLLRLSNHLGPCDESCCL